MLSERRKLLHNHFQRSISVFVPLINRGVSRIPSIGGYVPQQRARLMVHRSLRLVIIGHNLTFIPRWGTSTPRRGAVTYCQSFWAPLLFSVIWCNRIVGLKNHRSTWMQLLSLTGLLPHGLGKCLLIYLLRRRALQSWTGWRCLVRNGSDSSSPFHVLHCCQTVPVQWSTILRPIGFERGYGYVEQAIRLIVRGSSNTLPFATFSGCVLISAWVEMRALAAGKVPMIS